jgi:hypothetical protein
MFTRLFFPILSTILCVGLTFPALAAEGKEIKPVKEWKGSFPDEKDEPLAKETPKDERITNQKEWEKLWKAWRGKEEMPKIDFDKQLVLVASCSGAINTISPHFQLSEKGDLTGGFSMTEALGPGFAYLIVVFDREGVKTLNGKPIE